VSTPAQVGGYEWKSGLKRARAANEELRGLLKRMLREGGPVVQALAGRAALAVLDNENALQRLEEIGRQTK
jgi:hypothetical protein